VDTDRTCSEMDAVYSRAATDCRRVPSPTTATAKLFGVPHVAYFDHLQVLSLVGFAGIIELIGSPLLIVGLFTRPVAFVLSGEMAFAYFIGHVPQGSFLAPSLNQGEPAVLYCFVFLFFAAAGPGAWSVDASLHGARPNDRDSKV